MTGEKDNFLLHFSFFLFCRPPAFLAEALIFILNFYEVTEVKKSILRIGKMFGIQFIMVTYSGNSMNLSATFLCCIGDKFNTSKSKVENKRFQGLIRTISTE